MDGSLKQYSAAGNDTKARECYIALGCFCLANIRIVIGG